MKRVLIGIEDFKELISNNYYVDKSELIKDIINEKLFYILYQEGLVKH
ncbi:hypothetical protein [Thomasclavelia saccharogumia]|nr:hypothetical protein [Thomasclavelia saccharogumia]